MLTLRVDCCECVIYKAGITYNFPATWKKSGDSEQASNKRNEEIKILDKTNLRYGYNESKQVDKID